MGMGAAYVPNSFKMGLLSLGTPLDWSDAITHAKAVRSNGISQFLSIYRQTHKRRKDSLLWGDELEYLVVKFNPNHTCSLSLDAWKVLAELQRLSGDESHGVRSAWNPEYGRFMLEGTPAKPYGFNFIDFLCVEDNMRQRYVTFTHCIH